MMIKNSFYVSCFDGEDSTCGKVQKMEFYDSDLILTIFNGQDKIVKVPAKFCRCEFIMNVDEVDEIIRKNKIDPKDIQLKFFHMMYFNAREENKD